MFFSPAMKRRSQVTTRKQKPKRDVEKDYPRHQFVTKLRRLADALEQGKPFRIQVGGERISVPSVAVINIEHERGSSEEELEFQLKWPSAAKG
jgi:amphi-Trp domain-containing protein